MAKWLRKDAASATSSHGLRHGGMVNSELSCTVEISTVNHSAIQQYCQAVCVLARQQQQARSGTNRAAGNTALHL